MARPAGTPPTFATDANYTNSPGSDWQGTPTKVEPSSGEKGQGITPGRFIVSQWLNWAIGGFGAWLLYFSEIIGSDHEHTYPTPKALIVTVPGTSIVSGSTKIDGGGVFADATLEEGWRAYDSRVVAGSGPGGRDVVGRAPWSWCQAHGVIAYLPVYDVVTSDSVFTEIRIVCKPGTAIATAGDRMQFALLSIDPQGLTFSALETGTDDGTALDQTVILTVDPEITVSRNVRSYVLAVTASMGASPSTPDFIYGFEVRFNSPGPRN